MHTNIGVESGASIVIRIVCVYMYVCLVHDHQVFMCFYIHSIYSSTQEVVTGHAVKATVKNQHVNFLFENRMSTFSVWNENTFLHTIQNGSFKGLMIKVFE